MFSGYEHFHPKINSTPLNGKTNILKYRIYYIQKNRLCNTVSTKHFIILFIISTSKHLHAIKYDDEGIIQNDRDMKFSIEAIWQQKMRPSKKAQSNEVKWYAIYIH
jgi:hypothetical protein